MNVAAPVFLVYFFPSPLNYIFFIILPLKFTDYYCIINKNETIL